MNITSTLGLIMISIVAIAAVSGAWVLLEELQRLSNYNKYGQALRYPLVRVRRFVGRQKEKSISARQIDEDGRLLTLYFPHTVKGLKRGTILKGVPKTEIVE